MDNDYYSIDAILAENQKTQCTFSIDIPDLGYLEGGNARDIKANTKMQLPFWLLPMILISGCAKCSVPPAFAQKVRNALNAEPRSVKLSGLVGTGGLWYSFGRMLLDLVEEDQAQELYEMLSTTFKERLPEIMDQAQHFGALGTGAGGSGGGQAGEDFREGLDGTERELFSLAQESARLTKMWYESSDRAKR